MQTSKRLGSVRRIAWLAGAPLLAATSPAEAETYSFTNLELLQGWGFHDVYLGQATANGAMTTLTFEHFGTWEYGDNYFFADLYRGDFVDANGTPRDVPARIYSEWHPRLWVNRLAGVEGPILGIFRNLGVTGEVNQSGDGYWAYLGGVALDFALPAGSALGLSLYYKADRYIAPGAQATLSWSVPFRVGPVPVLTQGFVDVFTAKNAEGNYTAALFAQAQLLVDPLGSFQLPERRLYLGLEWYVSLNPVHSLQAPQVMAMWVL
jgi:nucleoside-specific outer membrane channel protein Tsx